MPVAQHDTSPMNPHARRNIFGTHSPICNDELSPEKRVVDVTSGTRPASRARGRVISTEEALQATNAVLDPYEMPAPEASHPQTSLKSPPPSSLTATPTPSLPLLSPQYDSRASTMTTPSLPSLSPAMPLLSRHSTPVPLSPDLSPHDQRLPRRPEGILPRRSQAEVEAAATAVEAAEAAARASKGAAEARKAAEDAARAARRDEEAEANRAAAERAAVAVLRSHAYEMTRTRKCGEDLTRRSTMKSRNCSFEAYSYAKNLGE